MEEFKLPATMTARPTALAVEAPKNAPEALPALTMELARGTSPQAVEDAVLATPALRPFSEDLVRMCGALNHQSSPPDNLGTAGLVLAAVYRNAPDEPARRAGLEELARHDLVRGALAPPDVPGAKAYFGAAFLAMWWLAALSATGHYYSSSNEGFLWTLIGEKLRHSFFFTATGSVLGLVAAYRLSPTRAGQLMRGLILQLFSLAYRQRMRKLDSEAALAAAAAAHAPLAALPRSVLVGTSPERLALSAVDPAGTQLVARLEYMRALAQAENSRWVLALVADLAQGALCGVLVLFLVCALL